MKKKGFFGSISSVLAGAGLAFAQPPAAPAPTIAVVPPATTKPVIIPPAAAAVPLTTTEGVLHAEGDLGCCDCAGKSYHAWGSAEYLMWWIKNGPVGGPLVWSFDPFTAQQTVLFGGGGSSFDYNAFAGGRVTIGAWLNKSATVGVEASGFLLERESTGVRFDSNAVGEPLLGVPFFNLQTGNASDFGEISFPRALFGGGLTGGILVSSTSRLWGAEMNAIANVSNSSKVKIGVLGGFRYLDLDESATLSVTSSSLPSDAQPYLGILFPFPSNIGVVNSFDTRNQFYGGQIGLRGQINSGPLYANAAAKIAFGATHQHVDVGASTTLTVPGLTTSTPGGFLVSPANVGRVTRDEFSIVPEVTVNVGANLTDNISAFVGYNFLYWTNVARPGDQINHAINPTEQPDFNEFGGGLSGPRQTRLTRDSEFWAQGINFGIGIRY